MFDNRLSYYHSLVFDFFWGGGGLLVLIYIGGIVSSVILVGADGNKIL